MKYLVVLDYVDEAERKRVEYLLFQKNEFEGLAQRLKGTTIILNEDKKTQELLKEILYKITPEKMNLYSIEELNVKNVAGIREIRTEIKFKFPECDIVFKDLSDAIDRILLQKNGILKKTNSPKPNYIIKEFTTSSNMGKCEIVVRYRIIKEVTEVLVELTGDIPIVDEMLGYMNREVGYLQSMEG